MRGAQPSKKRVKRKSVASAWWTHVVDRIQDLETLYACRAVCSQWRAHVDRACAHRFNKRIQAMVWRIEHVCNVSDWMPGAWASLAPHTRYAQLTFRNWHKKPDARSSIGRYLWKPTHKLFACCVAAFHPQSRTSFEPYELPLECGIARSVIDIGHNVVGSLHITRACGYLVYSATMGAMVHGEYRSYNIHFDALLAPFCALG